MIQNLKIYDSHCHFPNKGEMFPDYTWGKSVSFDTEGSRNHGEIWRKAFNFPQSSKPLDNDTEMADLWLKDIDEKHVEKIVFVSAGGNERLSKIIARHPGRFYGYAHHHPDSANAPQELEKAIAAYGLSGYKILGPLVDTSLSDKKYYPLWEVCSQKEIPVLIHFGLLGAAGGKADGVNISPLSIAQAALDFPKVNFIVPHFGCNHIGDLLQLCWTRPNVYVDSSGSNQWIRWMPYRLTLEDVIRKFVETIGPGRLMFATDSSWMPRGFATTYLEEQHKIFRFLGLSEEDLNKVFSENIAALLKLDS